MSMLVEQRRSRSLTGSMTWSEIDHPHESTYANRINVIVNACSNFHLFGHVRVRSAHCDVTKCWLLTCFLGNNPIIDL